MSPTTTIVDPQGNLSIATTVRRRPSIAKTLLQSSVSFMTRAINTHNQLNESHRYEKVILDIITAWEKAMKAYLHRKKIKLVKGDGWFITFNECLNKTAAKVGTQFVAAQKSLPILYNYRNGAQHFFGESWDAVLFGLVSESVVQYRKFIEEQCDHKFLNTDDLLIMPIGFQRPVVPQDFLTDLSVSRNATKEVKQFLKQISDAGGALQAQGVQDSVLVQFHVALVNVNRVENADVVVGVDNSRPQEATMTVTRPIQGQIQITSNPGAQLVQLSEQEAVDAGWNLTWRNEIQPFIKQSLPHVRINAAFHVRWRAIKADPTICRTRTLQPGNPNSTKIELYNELVYQRLINEFPVSELN